MQQCDQHNAMEKERGSMAANIANLTVAVGTLNTRLAEMIVQTHTRIDRVEERFNHHDTEGVKYREKIVMTERVLQQYMQHQEVRETRAMWRIGITVAILNALFVFAGVAASMQLCK